MNTTLALKHAKDLTREAPRSPRHRISGYVLMARMIDKGRATLNNTAGEYHFNCPVDNMLFSFKGVDGDEVKQVISSGASDNDIANWIIVRGTPRTAEEVKAWSDATEKVSFYKHPEKHGWFVGECERLGLDPARATLFDYLEEDDRVSFSK